MLYLRLSLVPMVVSPEEHYKALPYCSQDCADKDRELLNALLNVRNFTALAQVLQHSHELAEAVKCCHCGNSVSPGQWPREIARAEART